MTVTMNRGPVKTSKNLLSSADLGTLNRARVMRLLYAKGPLARAELAGLLQVNRGTMGTVVLPLLKEGVLVELPARSPRETGGKPAKPLWFGSAHTVGTYYVSPDACVASLVTMDGKVLRYESLELPGEIPTNITDVIADLGIRVFPRQGMLGIGAAFAGMVDTDHGAVIANYRSPSVHLLPIADKLESVFHVPVLVDHHPRIQALGDSWFGLGKQKDSFCSVVTGEVLGVGFVQGGEVVRGLQGSGGESGHMVVDLNGTKCLCGRTGCWETVATLPWLRRTAREVGLEHPESVSAETLAAGGDTGDLICARLMRKYASMIGVGLANLQQLLGIGVFIVHGDVAQGGETMRRLLEDYVVRNSPQREPLPSVLFAPTPDDSVALGAAALVLSNVFRTA